MVVSKTCINSVFIFIPFVLILLFCYSIWTEKKEYKGYIMSQNHQTSKPACVCNRSLTSEKEDLHSVKDKDKFSPVRKDKDEEYQTHFLQNVIIPQIIKASEPLPLESPSERPRITLRGTDYWVIYNFAKSTELFQHNETITFTTHCEYKYLENLGQILKRWDGAVSVSIYSPGEDYRRTVMTIQYFRECWPDKGIIRKRVDFHIFFPTTHIPKDISVQNDSDHSLADCDQLKDWIAGMPNTSYRLKNNLPYPINVARNIARESAKSTYIFAADIELYPSPGLAKMFLNMLKNNESHLNNLTSPRVFVAPVFEIAEGIEIPKNKSQLLKLIQTSDVIVFHQSFCSACHTIPNYQKWLDTPSSGKMSVVHVAKRNKSFGIWEPIFIGTNADPFYDERLSWDGRRDKMTQAIQLCLMDYDFMILSEAFLIHRNGIKTAVKNSKSTNQSRVAAQNKMINGQIIPEIKAIFGDNPEC